MKIILTLTCENPEEAEEARQYAGSLLHEVERRQWQGFPGAVLERGDAQVWVSGVELAE